MRFIKPDAPLSFLQKINASRGSSLEHSENHWKWLCDAGVIPKRLKDDVDVIRHHDRCMHKSETFVKSPNFIQDDLSRLRP